MLNWRTGSILDRKASVLEHKKLGDIASLKTGPFGTQLSASEYVESGIPVINVKNIGFHRQPEIAFLIIFSIQETSFSVERGRLTAMLISQLPKMAGCKAPTVFESVAYRELIPIMFLTI